MSFTDKSSTITAGGTAQTLSAARADHRSFLVQNISAGDLWINPFGDDAAAAKPSLRLSAGAFFESPVSTKKKLSIFGATTAQAFTCWEY